MRFRASFFATAATLILIAGPASAARIIVTIDGLHSAQGTVFVGLTQRRANSSTAISPTP